VPAFEFRGYNTDSTNGGLDIRTNLNGTFTDRVRITNDGLVGIGTTSPNYNLQVAGTDPTIAINATNPSASSVSTLLYRNADGNGNPRNVASIEGESAGNGGYGALAFHTAFNDSLLERFRCDASGRLLVGTSTSSQATRLVLQGNSASGTDSTVAIFAAGTATPSNGQVLGYLRFSDSGHVSAADIVAARDGGTWTSGSSQPTRLVFSTTADGASSPTERMRIQSDGNIGFFNTPGLYPNSDNAALLGFSAFRWSAVWAANGTIQTSDQRAKAEITGASLGADFIKALRPVSYKWIEGGKVDSGKRDEDGNFIYESVPGKRTHWGFIAQEVKQAVDDAGVDFGGWVLTDKDDPDSQQALRYDQFIAPLTKALQEAIAKIETLEGMVAVNNITIDEQQHQLSTLAARLTALESA
jgi:hypothetical protein